MLVSWPVLMSLHMKMFCGVRMPLMLDRKTHSCPPFGMPSATVAVPHTMLVYDVAFCMQQFQKKK